MLNYRTDTFLRLRQEMDSLANQNLLTSEKISTSQYHTFYSPQKIEEYEKFYSPK